MTIHGIDWSAIEWKTIRSGVEQKAFSGNSATIAMHRLQPDHEPKPHKHVYEQIAYIVSGTVDFHVGDEEVINIDIFTPARPHYAPVPKND